MSSYYLVSDSRYPHSEGGAFISNGHTTNSATADQTFSLVVDSSNNLHINSQLGGPNALITSLTIDPAGVVNVPNQLLVAGQPIVGGNAVTKLLAGPNISLNPTSGLGDVTITATGNGTGGFPNPVTTDLDMNSKSISGVYDISCSHIVTAESLYLYNSVANKTLHLSAPNGENEGCIRFN